MDPLQPNHHHHYEQSNHQAHHSLLQANGCGGEVKQGNCLGVGVGGGNCSPLSTGAGVLDTSTLRSNSHRLSPQMMCDPPEGDDTDPDVIPNQYGKYGFYNK